jgi:subtilisin family serine protease
MALKFLDAQGSGVTSDAIAALNYAVANGAKISNNSWGGGPFSQAFKTAIDNANAAGHIFVASAGNYGSNNDGSPFYPASYASPNVISVAATDAGDFIAYFSNYGRTSVDIGAPGVDIYSTLPTAMTPGMVNQGLEPNYGMLSGTSMAAPHVSGVLALLASANPGLSPAEAIAQVMKTADKVPSLATRSVSGGRVNAAAALGVVREDTTPPSILSNDPAGIMTGAIDRLTLTFSEAIDPSTFTLDDLLLMDGPEGSVTILSVEPTPNTGNTKFTVIFASQSLAGD